MSWPDPPAQPNQACVVDGGNSFKMTFSGSAPDQSNTPQPSSCSHRHRANSTAAPVSLVSVQGGTAPSKPIKLGDVHMLGLCLQLSPSSDLVVLVLSLGQTRVPDAVAQVDAQPEGQPPEQPPPSCLHHTRTHTRTLVSLQHREVEPWVVRTAVRLAMR